MARGVVGVSRAVACCRVRALVVFFFRFARAVPTSTQNLVYLENGPKILILHYPYITIPCSTGSIIYYNTIN